MTTLEHLRVINRTCPRPNCGGYIATKHVPVRCPFCNPARAQQPTDWGYVLLGASVYAGLIVLAILVGA